MKKYFRIKKIKKYEKSVHGISRKSYIRVLSGKILTGNIEIDSDSLLTDNEWWVPPTHYRRVYKIPFFNIYI